MVMAYCRVSYLRADLTFANIRGCITCQAVALSHLGLETSSNYWMRQSRVCRTFGPHIHTNNALISYDRITTDANDEATTPTCQCSGFTTRI